MFNLTTENPKENTKNIILLTSSSESNTKAFSKKNKKLKQKINLKKLNIKNRNRNIIHIYNSTNSSISKNSRNSFFSRNSLKDATNSYKTYNNKTKLTENEKKKIKSIIKVFRNHKVLTERLIKKEDILALNSVNNSNYSFLLRQNEEKSAKNKSRKLIYNNQYNDVSSFMINKFNNKTFGILDPPNREPMYSTNLNFFRRQLINNYNEFNKNTEYARRKYNNAMKIGEINDEKNIKLALDLEKKFYQNKYNILNDINFNQDIINKIKQHHGASRNSYFERNKEQLIQNSIKNHKTSLIFNSKDNEKKIDDIYLKKLYAINNISPMKTKSNEVNLNLYNNYIRLNKGHKTEISNDIIDNEKSMQKFKKIHDLKELNKIKQRSADYVNSFYEINNYPYEEFVISNLNDNKGVISRHNLTRAIKVNSINKYLYNLEDDDLLLHNPKKLKEEIMKVQIECNQNNYKTNYNFSFLRKKLRKETIIKFKHIKDSRFGFPV